MDFEYYYNLFAIPLTLLLGIYAFIILPQERKDSIKNGERRDFFDNFKIK